MGLSTQIWMLAVETWETRATVVVDLGQITVLCHGVLAGDAAVLTTLQPAPKEPHEIWEKLWCVLCHGSARAKSGCGGSGSGQSSGHLYGLRDR